MQNNHFELLLNNLFYDSPKSAYLALSQYPTIEDFTNNFNHFVSSLKNKSIDIYKKRFSQFKMQNFLSELETKQIKFITVSDKNYPSLLKEIHFPPLVLYYKGNLNLLFDPLIAVVGPRKNSSYGQDVCEHFCKELLPYLRIVSGLAAGIDSIAHKTALNNNHPTIAIIGNGFDTIYPYSNKALYESIVHKGLLISEFGPSVKPIPFHFPLRNRIVSGISKGVLVCEASEKSGSLITANVALEQNREVFVAPGSIFSDYSKGSNKLIQAGAKCVIRVKDILSELSISKTQFTVASKAMPNSNTDYQKDNPILNHINALPIQLEDLLKIVNEPLPIVLQHLTIFESLGLIKKLPGNKYVKV